MNANTFIQRMSETTHPLHLFECVPKARKCSLCNQTGHSIKKCNMPDAVDKFHELCEDFNEITLERLLDPNMISTRYTDFMDQTKKLKKNMLKYFLLQMSKNSYSHLTTKHKLYSMVMYHLIVAFLDWNIRFENNIPSMHLRFFNTERSYWLHLASGTSHEMAIHLYELRLNEILEQEQQKMNIRSKIIKIDLLKVIDEEGEECEKNDFDCPICLDVCSYESKTTLECNHAFCTECIQRCLKTCQENKMIPSCALCRYNYTKVYYNGDIPE